MAELILERISKFENVLWDWNGTLLNDAHIASDAEAELFRRHGMKAQTREERMKNFCFPIEVYYTKMGFDFSKVSYEAVSNEWLSIYESMVVNAELFKGAAEMIRSLHESGKRQFVLSAAPEDHVREMAARLSIHEYFEAIYALPHAKADSKIERGRDLVRDFKIDVSRSILVGDTAHDYEVAHALGCSVLLVGDGHAPIEALRKVDPQMLTSRYPKT